MGGESFVNKIADKVNPEISKRKTSVVGQSFIVRESTAAYNVHADGEMGIPRTQNTLDWR